MNIYIDESGDLGSIKKSGKYFIIALVATKNSREIDIWMRRVRSKKLNDKEKKFPEIKAILAKNRFKEYFFGHLNKLKFKVVFILIDKTKIPNRFKKEQGLVFLLMVKEGILSLISEKRDRILITVDRRHFQKITKEAFNTSLKEFLLTKGKIEGTITIHHTDSTTDRLIQFTDFIAFAIGKKRNQKDEIWYRHLKNFIKKEIILKIDNKK